MASQGIQTLLEAEKEASKIVAKARQYRTQRLKDARTEAVKEIEALKADKNAEFVIFEKQYGGSSSDAVAKVDVETEHALTQIQEHYRTNKDTVIAKLLHAVGTVKPELHPNAAMSGLL
ncbi:hypothetical protein SeMB42_g06508 [Synchytrium endobioticum]|uniref:V-type proton ATPase subunit G n=1 Tax=Synchytrium endobioticum TaxID=286115 RepID=A0A507CV81_9FUNG|nr:hypothetical protein SeMB42_g06508 [Synchytrium endobioticum]TPX43035.1 hypothetical protein SeLEV6574_g05280 [Synchytrium endobioticum]